MADAAAVRIVPPLEVLAPIQDLIDVLDTARVVPDQKLAKVFDRAPQRQLATGGAGFAQPMDAGIGLDLDHEPAAMADGRLEVLDVCDLHGEASSSRAASPEARASDRRS